MIVGTVPRPFGSCTMPLKRLKKSSLLFSLSTYLVTNGIPCRHTNRSFVRNSIIKDKKKYHTDADESQLLN